MVILGLDAGSVSVKTALLDEAGRVLKTSYVRHRGNPLKASLEAVLETIRESRIDALAVTGTAGKSIAAGLGFSPVNEIVAQAAAAKKLLPEVRTIIEMGGEDSKLIFLDGSGIRDFSMNSVCAAGTGSFLDQQAERLRLGIEEFGRTALVSKNPPRIAGRCSVFAKSDMIHLQQIATPVEDIVAGLCFAVARNFKGSIAKGRQMISPVSFHGGVAANPGMRRAFSEILGLDHLVIPEHFACMGAIGAGLKAISEGTLIPPDIDSLRRITEKTEIRHSSLPPLISADDDFHRRHIKSSGTELRPDSLPSKIESYMGIDIGSISTNLAVIDSRGRVLAKRYLMTAGRPIEAVIQGLREIQNELGPGVEIRGVGTTGSGRYMIADFVGADVVKNEITAQATAAAFIDPGVDTIFEIGGQDSKYISMENGVIVDFEMNKACAAGTGSFLEEQAEKLSISIKEEFTQNALSSDSPCSLGERCTVFMENSLMANLKRGVEKDDLLAGLAYSIVENYINRVVNGKKIGESIFFQGGVAFNKSVVAAFEKFLEKKVVVPPDHDVTGAIGMALIAKDFRSENVAGESRFKGFSICDRRYEASSFECRGCPNVCEINRIRIEGENEFLFYGGRCEKYDIKRNRENTLPDLFAYREEILWKEHLRRAELEEEAGGNGNGTRARKSIGIPYIFFFHDYLPFWSTLFWELGFRVVVSPRTNRQIVNLGVEAIQTESCFPVKIAHGHIRYLLDSGIDYVFLPSFINVSDPGTDPATGSPCPYTQTIPYLARAAFSSERILSPVMDLSRGAEYMINELHRILKPFGITGRELKSACRKAQESQDEFTSARLEKGREVLSNVKENAIVIVGRGYNAFESGVNLQIPHKLASLDILSIPMDFLPLDDSDISDRWATMYWRNGQRILKAARIIKSHPYLYPVFIGNFSCGPDSFIIRYFGEELGDKPFLHIEIDEHSADAGAITRCEAYLDSIRNRRANNPSPSLTSSAPAKTDLKNRKIFITRMSDHAFALEAAFEACGIEAEVLPETDEQAIKLGKKHVSGKECYPCAVTTGDMLKKVFSPEFDPSRSAFFMPSGTGPCRFGQYNVLQRLLLDRCGLPEVKIYSPVQSTAFYSDLGIVGRDFVTKTWKGVIGIELLIKMLHETRPYERTSGETDSTYNHFLEEIRGAAAGKNGSLAGVLDDMKDAFGAIPIVLEERPLIGIVGEIFVRSNIFSNESIVRRVEELGGEVWLSPFEEWIHYVNYTSIRKALRKRDKSAIIELFLKSFFQKRIEHRYSRIFEGCLKSLREPQVRTILSKANPYIHDSFEGEAVLSIGKVIDLVEKGASGIINVMPFGCMPGTIVNALLQDISRKYDVPCISIAYDGTESTGTYLQLEAFMEQARSRKKKTALTG